MKQATHTFVIPTKGQGLTDISVDVEKWAAAQNITTGLLTLFLQHTSASLIIQENADPDVLHDLQSFFARLAPEDGSYRHSAEGLDDMPAHIKAALTMTHLSIPIAEGRLVLGTWQGIYVFEHRRHAHKRQLVAHIFGE